MTALPQEDMCPMAFLVLTAGAGLATRLCHAQRILGVALLGLGLVGLARPAFADQNLLASDNGTIRCEASLKDLTRITLTNDQFASISKVQATNPAEDFDVVNEPLRGDIYISVGQGFSKPAISFFATTRKGYVYKFLCAVGGADAKQVFVANAGMTAPRALGEELPAGLSPQEEATRLIAALYAQRSVAGYDIDWRPLVPVSTGAVTVQRIGHYQGQRLVATLLKLTNTGTKPLALREEDLGPPDAVAISLANPTLAPGEATTAFVVVSRNAQGDRP